MQRARNKPSMGTTVAYVLLLALIACSLAGDVSALSELVKDDHLEGPNVCKEVENITVMITTPREEAYQERYQKWCLGIPPRCSAYRIKIRTVNDTRTIIKQRIVKKCCVGYELDEGQQHCVPQCKAGCRYGKCIQPDVCRCDQGYAGKTCNIQCPPNLWGSDCSQKCKCMNGAICNAADGSCNCQRGYKGRYCEEICPSHRFGQDCAELCRCENGGKCDHVSGECYCAAGFTGPLCAESCPPGTHGAQCQSKCRCQNGGTCDPVTGECVCPAGYTGLVCANRCQPGLYGLKCANRCECFNGADCDRVTGQCICAPGFMGAKCLDSCPSNQYGINCTETCRCQNGAPCDTADGSCTCPDGWTGVDCGKRICPANQYGANCTGICECNASNTKMCHPWTGKCLCKPGWSNTACDRPCRFLRYGQDCQLSCNCKNSSPCSHIDGTCLCIAGFKGESCEEPCSNNTYGQNCSERCQCMNGATCEGDSGKCVCAPGWQGIKCDRPCDAQHYGRDCTEECHCQNGGVCNPINGVCTCPAGWTGELCDKKCTPGRFGQNCEQVCDCHTHNTLACNATTGRCICKTDWGGVRCESRCPLGYYGETCSEICTCHNNSSCDPTSGQCICSRGWTGPTCSDPCPKGYFGHGCKEPCPGSSDGNGTCNPITGRFHCPPGYVGPTCEHPCASGFYGQDCTQVCNCKNGGECSHVTGQCQCSPGWKGERCETVCEDMYYGTNCSQRCNCHNNAKCRKNDGNCICEAGWMGHRCDEVCPDGFYGNHCMNTCECPPGNFACHAAKGCVCTMGWTGKNCDERMTNKYTQDRADEETLSRGSTLYTIRIELLNATDTHQHERDQSVVVGGATPHAGKPAAAYNVTLAFPLYANSMLTTYDRTHSLRPGQQITLLYREQAFLELTLVQMNSYVTLSDTVGEESVSSSSNFMETFINSTSYRVAIEEELLVNVSCVDLQKRWGDRGGGECDRNRSIRLQVGQKIVVRLATTTMDEPVTVMSTNDETSDDFVSPAEVSFISTHATDERSVERTTVGFVGVENTEQNVNNLGESNVESTISYYESGVAPVETTQGVETRTVEVTMPYQQEHVEEPVSIATTHSMSPIAPPRTFDDGPTLELPSAKANEDDSHLLEDENATKHSDVSTTHTWIAVSTTTSWSGDFTTNPALDHFDGDDSTPTGDEDLTKALSTSTSSQQHLAVTIAATKDVLHRDENYQPNEVVATLNDSAPTGFAPVSSNPREAYLNVWKSIFQALYSSPRSDEGGYHWEQRDVENETVNASIVAERFGASDRVLASSSSGTVWALVLTILFVSILAVLLLYYRRRVANLKAEVNHVVNYMTQEQPSHFDNPVYARTGGPNGGGTLASNGTVVPPLDARTGLLRNVLPNNLRDVVSGRRKQNQDKYSYPDNNEYGVDKSYSISHYGPESLKNFEADLTNPNCFKDHVYDEIRLKDSIDTEYDHLDYSRPGSSHKAHYFRMTDGNGTVNGSIPGSPLPNGSAGSPGTSGTAGGSPKAINVMRDANGGPINNLSAPPRFNNLLPSVAEAKYGNADSNVDGTNASATGGPSLGNDLSSSSNSSPTPPSPPPSHQQQRQRLVPAGDDVYLPMTSTTAGGSESGGSSSSATSSTGSDFAGLIKIPDHQLNIKE